MFGCPASHLARQRWERMATLALTGAERQKAADLIQTLLDMCEALVLPGDTGLTIIRYTVEPAIPSAQALQCLANLGQPRAARESCASKCAAV